MILHFTIISALGAVYTHHIGSVSRDFSWCLKSPVVSVFTPRKLQMLQIRAYSSQPDPQHPHVADEGTEA